jgi:hypothetical protein
VKTSSKIRSADDYAKYESEKGALEQNLRDKLSPEQMELFELRMAMNMAKMSGSKKMDKGALLTGFMQLYGPENAEIAKLKAEQFSSPEFLKAKMDQLRVEQNRLNTKEVDEFNTRNSSLLRYYYDFQNWRQKLSNKIFGTDEDSLGAKLGIITTDAEKDYEEAKKAGVLKLQDYNLLTLDNIKIQTKSRVYADPIIIKYSETIKNKSVILITDDYDVKIRANHFKGNDDSQAILGKDLIKELYGGIEM